MNAIFVCNESTLTSIPDGLAYTKSLTSRLFPNRLSFTSDAVIVEFVIRPAIGSHREQITLELSATL